MQTIENGSSWVTAVRYMPAFRCLAVTAFSRTLTMYDLTSPFCTAVGSIPKMAFTPMAMDVVPARGDAAAQQVMIGDAGGQVHLHKVTPHTDNDAFQVRDCRWLRHLAVAQQTWQT